MGPGQDRRMGLSGMLYILFAEDCDEGSADLRKANVEAHLAYLGRHKERLVLGGAMLAEDGSTRIGSVLILNLPSMTEAEAFAMGEPFRNAGVYKNVRLARMRRAQWNPDAAPATPDGN